MNKHLFFLNFTALFLLITTSLLGKEKNDQTPVYLVSASEVNKILLLNSDDEIIREIPARNTYDGWMLKNNNILYNVDRGVEIISPTNNKILSYKSEHEVYTCQPINNQRILVGECTAGRLIELNRKGEIKKTIPLTFKVGGHTCFRGARKIKNGNYLVAHYGDKTVREYDKKGKVLQEFVRPNHVYSAQRLQNGNTVISDRYTISIYNKKGEMIWEFNSKNHTELGVYHLTGFECLPNGDIAVCNWLGHKPYHTGVPLFKISRDKKVIWKYTNEKATYSCTNIHFL